MRMIQKRMEEQYKGKSSSSRLLMIPPNPRSRTARLSAILKGALQIDQKSKAERWCFGSTGITSRIIARKKPPPSQLSLHIFVSQIRQNWRRGSTVILFNVFFFRNGNIL